MADSVAADVERTILDNGLELLLARKDGVPLVTVEIAIRAGSFIESPEMDGLTHLHEHMFFKANEVIRDQETYLRRLDELGMSWNGSTSNEVVRYFFTLPSELIEEGLVFMRDAIQTPLFLEEELERERKVVIGEYDRYEANPATHLRRAVNEGLFRKHFSRKNPIGDREIITTATREKLQWIQDEFYVPNNAALIIAGDFEPARAFALAERIFGEWARRPDPFDRNRIPEHPPLLDDEFHLVEQEVRTPAVMLGWHGPSVGRDSRMTVIADVLSTVLADPSSRFQRHLVDSGLCASASLGYYTQKFVGPVYASLSVEAKKLLEAISTLGDEIDALGRGEGITEEELSRAKREIVQTEVFGREKTRDFAIALGFWWSVGGTDYYFEYPRVVESVTLEELHDFARRYLSRKVVLGAMLLSDTARLQGLDEASLRRAWRRAAETESGADLESLALGSSRLLYKQRDGHVGAIQIYFESPGSRVAARDAGVEELLVRTLVDRFEKEHLDELNRLGAKLVTQFHADYTMLGAECLADSVPAVATLLREAIVKTTFDASDLERNRRRMLVRLAQLMDNPQSRVSFVVNETFYPAGHPYRVYASGTSESLERLTLDDLQAHRTKLRQSGGALVTVVAPQSLASVREKLEESFGDVSTGSRPALELPELGAAGKNRLTIEEKDIPSNYVLGKFRAANPGERDHEILRLALQILSRKLWLEVRSKRALTYAVGSNMITRARSMGYVSVSTTKPNEAIRVIFETVDYLIANPPTVEELRAAARTFSTNQYLAQEAPRDLATLLATEMLRTGKPERALSLSQRLLDVSPEDIRRVLEESVREIHFGVVGPAEDLDRELFLSR